MKPFSLVWVAALTLSAALELQAQTPTRINLVEAPPFIVLQIYRELSGLELVTSSQVNAVTARVTLQPIEAFGKAEMLKLIEKALLEQAGIVVTKLDDKRASVTFNGALPTRVVKPLPKPVGSDGKPIQLPPPPPPQPM